MNQENTIAVGCDDGHHSIKLVFEHPECPGKLQELAIRSTAVKGTSQVLSFHEENDIYESAGEIFTVTDDFNVANTLDTRYKGYPLSAQNRILIHHALSKAGLAGKAIRLVSGLPYDQYYAVRKQNRTLIDGKIASVQTPVTTPNSTKLATIVKNTVMSEGIAALMAVLLDSDGKICQAHSDLLQQPVTVVDLGGKTLDIVTVTRGVNGVFFEASGTKEVGTLYLETKLASLLKHHFGMSADPAKAFVSKSLYSFQYQFHGKTHNVRNLVDEASEIYVENIRNAVIEIAGRLSDLAAMVFVGGGSALLQKMHGDSFFKNFYDGQIIVPERPEFANARGMYLHAKTLEG